jgi:hypothetical protein
MGHPTSSLNDIIAEGVHPPIMQGPMQYQQRLPGEEKKTPFSLFTWEMSLELLGAQKEHSPQWRDVLTLYAFFHPSSISEWLFKTKKEKLKRSPMSIFYNDHDEWDHLEFRDAIAEMQELSLWMGIKL